MGSARGHRVGRDASLCEARFVDGLTDGEVEELFRSAREPEYREISRQAERLRNSLSKKSKASGAEHKTARGGIGKAA